MVSVAVSATMFAIRFVSAVIIAMRSRVLRMLAAAVTVAIIIFTMPFATVG